MQMIARIALWWTTVPLVLESVAVGGADTGVSLQVDGGARVGTAESRQPRVGAVRECRSFGGLAEPPSVTAVNRAQPGTVGRDDSLLRVIVLRQVTAGPPRSGRVLLLSRT